MKRRALLITIASALILSTTPSKGVVTGQAGSGGPAQRGQLVVKFRPGTSDNEIARVHTRSAATVRYRSRHTGWEALSLPPGADPVQAVERYRRNPKIEAAEWVLPRHVSRVPNDLRSNQWALLNVGQTLHVCYDGYTGEETPCSPDVATHEYTGLDDADIDADLAWDLAIGSKRIVVAVLDTGVDHSRGDLSDRLVEGHDFINGDNLASDDHGHGTTVASVIGAIGNNGVGITGVNWKVSIMPVKVCDGQGACPAFALLAGIDYAVDHGADVINMSLSCDEHKDPVSGSCGTSKAANCYSQSEHDAVKAARDARVTLVAAAGNCASSVDGQARSYPCAYDIDGLICAGATDPWDQVAFFSNFGPGTVEIGAPGDLLLALKKSPPGGLLFAKGTSFSAPVTAGAAALLLSRTPFTPELVRDRIVGGGESGVHPTIDLADFFTGGRLNVYNTLQDVFLRRRIYSKERLGHVRLIADVTGDGRGDLVRGFDGTGFRVSFNSAKKRRFLDSKLWTGVRPTSAVLAGDVNDDGREELILGDASGFRVLIKRPLKPRFRAPEVWSTEPAGLLHAAGDVDADGLVDIVRFDGDFDVLLSTGASFQAPATWSGDTAGASIAAADVNGDGRSDLVNWFNAGGATQVEISLSTGSGFTPSALWFDGDELEFHGADDFDADGLADLLGLDPSSGCLSVIRSTGSSFESPRVWSCPRIGTDAILTGRVGWNGDTRTDVVIHFQGRCWRLFESAH